MKRIHYLTIIILTAICASCGRDDDFEAMPRPISTFVCRYWPNPNIESYTHPSADTYIVIIRNGPSLTFGPSYEWTSIDGRGLPLPQVLIYDQLPDPLYRYLSETESTGNIFKITRTPRMQTIYLLESTLTYDPATHAIHTI